MKLSIKTIALVTTITLLSNTTFAGTSSSFLNNEFEYTAGGVKYKNLGVPKYWQEDKCWCGIAAIEMWSDYLNGKNNYSDYNEQLSLAYKYDVGAYVKDDKYRDGWTCLGFEGETNGLKVNDIRIAMKNETGKRFRNYRRTSDHYIMRRIEQEINSNQPVVFSGNTIYKDRKRSARSGGHYFVINGMIQSNFGDKLPIGLWVNDPADGRVTSYVKPARYITKRSFLNKYLAKYNEGGITYKYLVYQN